MSVFKLPVVFLFAFSRISFALTNIGNWEACGGRLERALDALHRDSSRRNRLEEEEVNTSYQQELRSAPLEMSVSRIAVKLPQGARETGTSPWARVEKCIYDSDNNSLQTRVMLNDLTVSGFVSLMPRDHQPPIPAESCRMTLRLRRAGIDFLTNPIARGRGQMRIRTESSFLEPRFASIYAYGCHARRLEKQIKRQDKWPPLYPPHEEYTVLPLTSNDDYEAAEPRQLVGVSKEVDVVIPNEDRQSRLLNPPITKLGIWRKNIWLTKPPLRERRALFPSKSISDVLQVPSSVSRFPGSFESNQEDGHRSQRISRSAETITPQDFANALTSKRAEANETGGCADRRDRGDRGDRGDAKSPTNRFMSNLTDKEPKFNVKREDNHQATKTDIPRETRQLYENENVDNIFSFDLENDGRSWQTKEHVAREMEDVFLRGASQALTRYIEKQLHPAIKETLMISMGYTISYG